ncbi:cellulase family glycosylhydrolase [Mycolicibacterium sp. 050232]|uniref:cellulase family glycosylhydrolase n=1 Tax=Mycolicibacterium sp. 050232 TaxID=3113982 RepID=UPI002E2A0AD7|nr:cellulase family glycosylhydrolase [Mycolicibacterium sp. 050232]MED5814340.1 cellulase family glycosylhydrolase [Mycolicibacterium sp. 050232]
MTARRWLVCLLLLGMVSSTVSACQSPHPAAIGMNVHYRDDDAATVKRQFDLMAAMNVDWVRVDVDWSAIEPERGEFDWEPADLLVDEALAHQMNVLIVLSYTPDWARSSATDTKSPDSHFRPVDSMSYARFARATAQRYASRGVHHWEIWNEPNSTKFWPPRPDPDEYGALFRVIRAAIREVDPTAELLIGGLAPPYDPTDISATNYLEQLYANGTAQLADAVAVHPYSNPALPIMGEQSSGGLKDIPALHAVMDRHGDTTKSIWITEFGAATGTAPDAVSEQDQAATLEWARLEAERWDWAGPLIYYELVDGGTDVNDIEQNYGVLRADLSPKQAAIDLTNGVSN